MFKPAHFLALISCLSLTSMQAVAALTAYQATYSVANSGLTVGDTTVTLSYTAKGYTFQKVTKANGFAALLSGDTLTERSTGVKQGNKLQTQEYFFQHKSRRKSKTDQYNFTNPTQVQGSLDHKAYTVTVPNGTLDPAVVELRVREDVAANRPLKYHITERGKLKTYQFQRLGKEKVSTPFGQYDCDKVQVTRDGGERQTTLWIAAELDHLTVKMQHNEEGNVTEVILTNYQAK